MFSHCEVKMTSYIKIFFKILIQGLKITLSTKFELDQVIILNIIQVLLFFNGKNDVTHCKQKVVMATSDKNGY